MTTFFIALSAAFLMVIVLLIGVWFDSKGRDTMSFIWLTAFTYFGCLRLIEFVWRLISNA